jgi:hypothetical protein
LANIKASHSDLLEMDEDELEIQHQLAKVAKAREDADLARLKREREAGTLVAASDVRTRLQEIAATVIGVLTPGVWVDLREVVDAMDPQTRQALKLAHDRAITRLRDRMAEALANPTKFKTREDKNGHQ